MSEIILTPAEQATIGEDAYFFMPCIAEFAFLVDRYGFRRHLCRECRGQIFVLFENGQVEIYVGYEPCWPPWCHVFERQADKFKQRPIAQITADVPRPDPFSSFPEGYERLAQEWLAKAASKLRNSMDRIMQTYRPECT